MENRAAPENKRYTLTDEIIDTVIALKNAAVKEHRQFDQFQNRKFNTPEGRFETYEIQALKFVDYVLGDYEFPARDRFNAFLDTLTDDNLLDLLLLYYMAETVDATISVEPGEPRFLDYYYGNDHLWYIDREFLIEKLNEKTPLPEMLRKARCILNMPKDNGPHLTYRILHF